MQKLVFNRRQSANISARVSRFHFVSRLVDAERGQRHGYDYEDYRCRLVGLSIHVRGCQLLVQLADRSALLCDGRL